MRFLVDAHLPRRLCTILVQHGHDATHTLDLPTGNKTKDPIINQVSVLEQRVVVSKGSDFFYSHVLHGRPWKLLLIKTGNISSQTSVSCWSGTYQPLKQSSNPTRWSKSTVRPLPP